MSMIDNLRAQRAEVQAEFDRLTGLDAPTPEDVAAARAAGVDLESRDAAIVELEAADKRSKAAAEARATAGAPAVEHVSPAVVTSEARTYTAAADRRGLENGGHSYVSDLFRAQYLSDFSAQDRLRRHAREAEVLGEVEQRAVTTGGFAGAVVPQYLTDLAALVARNGRPYANSVRSLPLPEQGMSLIIPRGTTGAAVLSQATENTAVQSTDEVWANLTVPVVTIAGQQDLSRQAVERGIPGLDSLVYVDLSGAYHAELDRQCLAGSGASNQMLGVQNTAGITQAAAFGAPITAALFMTKLAGAIQSIEAAGTIVGPANLIVMHPRRFGWISSLADSQGRPLVTPVENGLQVVNGFGSTTAPGQMSAATIGTGGAVIKGYLQGIPVITDANVPTSVGSGPEDLVFVVNTAHQLLWEAGDGGPTQLRFEQTLGNQLTVKLVAYGYAAYTAGRYPLAATLIGGNATIGNGLIAPTF